MSAHWSLRLIHFLYVAFMSIAAWMQRHRRRQPHTLKARRNKIPNHLCLNLVADNDMPVEETETAFLQCLQSVAEWCRVLGIEILSVYDRDGVLYDCSEDARRRVFVVDEISEDSCESEVDYPLTPPLSEASGSRSHSPEHAKPPADLNMITMKPIPRLRKRRDVAVRRHPKSNRASPHSNLTLHVVSRASGKPAIVSASRTLLHRYVSGASTLEDTLPSRFPYNLAIAELATVLEACLLPPDLMIIHYVGGMKVPYSPIELHGFPPWQMTLTEFHRTDPDDGQEFDASLRAPVLISEAAFCRALDEYSGVQFRLGR